MTEHRTHWHRKTQIFAEWWQQELGIKTWFPFMDLPFLDRLDQLKVALVENSLRKSWDCKSLKIKLAVATASTQIRRSPSLFNAGSTCILSRFKDWGKSGWTSTSQHIFLLLRKSFVLFDCLGWWPKQARSPGAEEPNSGLFKIRGCCWPTSLALAWWYERLRCV